MTKFLDIMNLGQTPLETIISLYRQGYSIDIGHTRYKELGYPIDTKKSVSSLATCQNTSCPCTLPINTSQTLTAVAGSGTPPYTYHWSISKPDGTTDTSPTDYTFTYNFSQEGNYIVAIYVIDSTSKISNTDSCTVTVSSPLPTAGYNCVNGNCQYVTSGATYSTLSACQSACQQACIPNWHCRQPLDGYEHDANNCPGSVDRLNSACNPTGGVTGCQLCNPSTDFCIADTCIKKIYALYGTIGFAALYILTL